jgi:hypothetical protein
MLLQVHTTVLTDHLNLKYWMEPRELNPRQARWVEIISPFRLEIVYRPGKLAVMPDALSRRADYHPTVHDKAQNFVQALPSFQEDPDTTNDPTTLGALQRPMNTTFEDVVSEDEIRIGLAKDTIVAPIRHDMMSIICRRCKHPTCHDLKTHSTTLEDLRRKSRNQSLQNPSWSPQGLLRVDSRLYIPDHGDIRLRIMKSRHDSPLAGHQGYVCQDCRTHISKLCLVRHEQGHRDLYLRMCSMPKDETVETGTGRTPQDSRNSHSTVE